MKITLISAGVTPGDAWGLTAQNPQMQSLCSSPFQHHSSPEVGFVICYTLKRNQEDGHMGRMGFALKLLIFLSTCINNFLKSLPQNKMLVLLFKDLESLIVLISEPKDLAPECKIQDKIQA